ncbi:hypothetical protein ACP70R_006275 [Stipagrostis hirtigluma subsp. patula]
MNGQGTSTAADPIHCPPPPIESFEAPALMRPRPAVALLVFGAVPAAGAPQVADPR